MEGEVALEVASIQSEYLPGADTMVSVDGWMKGFISKLLHITHSQWIYRNVSLHHQKLGALETRERQHLLRQIDHLTDMDSASVPEESRFLLEIDFEQLRVGMTETQRYWVHAIQAAFKAGRRTAQRRQGHRSQFDCSTVPREPHQQPHRHQEGAAEGQGQDTGPLHQNAHDAPRPGQPPRGSAAEVRELCHRPRPLDHNAP